VPLIASLSRRCLRELQSSVLLARGSSRRSTEAVPNALQNAMLVALVFAGRAISGRGFGAVTRSSCSRPRPGEFAFVLIRIVSDFYSPAHSLHVVYFGSWRTSWHSRDSMLVGGPDG